MTPLFAAYIAPARPRAELWRTALGFLLIVAVYLGGMAAVAGLIWALVSIDALEAGLIRLAEGEDPVAVLILLGTFAGGWLGTWMVARWLHGRSLGSLLGRAPRVLADFVLGAAVLFVVGGGLGALALPWLPALEPATPPAAWLALLPLALAGVLIQTGAEELVFRGYLQQQLAARIAQPLVWMVLPSILFGLAHFSPETSGEATWLVVAVTGLFGLMAADLTARSGNLGMAWGLHFANNVLAIMVVSAMPGLDGLALFRLAERGPEILIPLLWFSMALLVAVWGTCRLVLARR